jgi:hypothetical protein
LECDEAGIQHAIVMQSPKAIDVTHQDFSVRLDSESLDDIVEGGRLESCVGRTILIQP